MLLLSQPSMFSAYMCIWMLISVDLTSVVDVIALLSYVWIDEVYV